MGAKVSNTSDRIKEVMKEQHLKQVDIVRKVELLSDIYGITFSRPPMSQYVSGKHQPEGERLSVLAIVLNVSEAWLAGYDVPKTRSESGEDKEKEKILNWLQSASDRDLLDVISSATEILRSK